MSRKNYGIATKRYGEVAFNKVIEEIVGDFLEKHREIKDEVPYDKKITELSEEEMEAFKKRISGLSVKSENGYSITIPCVKFKGIEMIEAVAQLPPEIQANSEEAELLLKERLGKEEHFHASEMWGSYETDFLAIQESETIGQYLARMEECISLITKCIEGEKVQFNEYGVLDNETRESLVQAYSNIGITSSDIELAYGIIAKTKNERDNNRSTKEQGQEL